MVREGTAQDREREAKTGEGEGEVPGERGKVGSYSVVNLTGLPHLQRKTRVMMASWPVEVARKTATKSTKRIAPSTVQLGTFWLPWLRFILDFSSVVSRMPGYNIWCIPPQSWRFHQVPAQCRVLTSATMPFWVQIPESLRTIICPPPSSLKSVVNKFRPPVCPIVVLKRDVNPLA